MTSKVTVLQGLDQALSRLFGCMVRPKIRWNRATCIALIALIAVCGALMCLTWASWGEPTPDSGREMYVPTVLSEGKVLYRDVWYSYGPAAPYFNSVLFRLFGVHLNVLYSAGALAALGSAIVLYLVGMRLGSAAIGFSVGSIVLVQAFASWLFSFPLPYSYASVYGCLTACIFLWFVIEASSSAQRRWIIGAATAAAIALLLKTEYGIACYITLILLIAARSFQQRSAKSILKDLLTILPGVLSCLIVFLWMVSIGGMKFIIQENLAAGGTSWPGSYFMKTYGRAWLENSGLVISEAALAQAVVRLSILGAIVLSLRWILRSSRSERTLVFLGAEISVVALALLVPHLPWEAEALFRWICFPQDMVLICAVSAVPSWWYFYRHRSAENPTLPLLFTFSSLLGLRILSGMQPTGYPIYYNGPALLSFLLILSTLILPKNKRSPSFVRQAQVLVCFNCLLAAVFYTNPFLALESDIVTLTTARGTIRIPRHIAQNYEAAILFMKEKDASGDTVLSIPDDTSLYFFSSTHCPTRIIVFQPGILVPGTMTDKLILEMETKQIHYLLWSNRTFPQYAFRTFGSDYDQAFASYLRAHYRPLRPLDPDNGPGWDAVIWERLPDGHNP
jgi:hypothetical protein